MRENLKNSILRQNNALPGGRIGSLVERSSQVFSSQSIQKLHLIRNIQTLFGSKRSLDLVDIN